VSFLKIIDENEVLSLEIFTKLKPSGPTIEFEDKAWGQSWPYFLL
jgi:hypothetical protein